MPQAGGFFLRSRSLFVFRRGAIAPYQLVTAPSDAEDTCLAYFAMTPLV
jgi:hypothetical protein